MVSLVMNKINNIIISNVIFRNIFISHEINSIHKAKTKLNTPDYRGVLLEKQKKSTI